MTVLRDRVLPPLRPPPKSGGVVALDEGAGLDRWVEGSPEQVAVDVGGDCHTCRFGVGDPRSAGHPRNCCRSLASNAAISARSWSSHRAATSEVGGRRQRRSSPPGPQPRPGRSPARYESSLMPACPRAGRSRRSPGTP